MIIIQFIWIGAIVLAGYLMPQNLEIPVVDAQIHDYNQSSYWAYPWGKSVGHKGVDIFATKGMPVVSATHGILLSAGYSKVAGHYILILGPKWRMHYYAHLDNIEKVKNRLIHKGQPFGTVGDSGNAKGKPCHLHYAILTTIPYFWLADDSIMGWKKAWYLNPIPFLNATFRSGFLKSSS